MSDRLLHIPCEARRFFIYEAKKLSLSKLCLAKLVWFLSHYFLTCSLLQTSQSPSHLPLMHLIFREIHPQPNGNFSLSAQPNLLLLKRCYWNVANLQCVHLCYTTKCFTHTHPYIYYIYKICNIYNIYIIFHILYHCGLSQDTEYSFLCYTVGPCCQIYLFNTPILLLHPFMRPFLVTSSLLTCTLYLHVVSVPCNYIFNPCHWWLYVLPP